MSAPIVAFFGHRRGAGTTSLVYHVAWMLSEMGRRALVMDLDPQADLSEAMLDQEILASLWDAPAEAGSTIASAIEPLVCGGVPVVPQIRRLTDHLSLIPGDLRLARIEEVLAALWSNAAPAADPTDFLRAQGSFWNVARQADREIGAEVVLVDLGPNLGAINHAAVLASDFIIISVADDRLAVLALREIGVAFRRWRARWKGHPAHTSGSMPATIAPIGYVVRKRAIGPRSVRDPGDDRLHRIASQYRAELVDDAHVVSSDPDCIAVIKPFHSLTRMSAEARRPMFLLRAADGAVGAHALAVQTAYADFSALTLEILRRIGQR